VDFYRFRPMDKLLGEHKELENQSIFFASPEQLNDPMEGYRDFFWSGDQIVWINLFRHYLRCLDHACFMLMVAGEKGQKLSLDDWLLRAGRDDFPTDLYRKRFLEVEARFFQDQRIVRLTEGIASVKHPVRRNELLFYLKSAHFAALDSIHEVNVAQGLMKKVEGQQTGPQPRPPDENDDYFQLLATIAENDAALNALFDVCALMDTQLRLLHQVTNASGTARENQDFVVVEFPERYIKEIERLIFPDWYTACFMSGCSNSSVWGHYGSNHTGACLIFDSQEAHGRPYIPLTGYNSASSTSGPGKERMQMEFHPVRYAEGYAKIDFFQSIGRLNSSTLMSTWFSDGQGNFSRCAEPLMTDEEAWRSRYWSSFIGDVVRKTKDWAYELEHRLVLHGSLVDYSNPAHRVLNYDFASLRGIIFGINTRVQDKIEVMRIIERKCTENSRATFAFYQAFYSSKTASIECAPLSMLQLSSVGSVTA